MAWCEANSVRLLVGLCRRIDRLVAEIAERGIAQAEAKSRRTGKTGAVLQGLPVDDAPQLGARRTPPASAREGRVHHGRSQPALRRGPRSSEPNASTGIPITKSSTAPAAIWRTGSRSASSNLYADRTSTATMRANQLRLWLASFGLTSCSAPCVGIGLGSTRHLPTRAAALSGSSCSRSARSCASASAASRSRCASSCPAAEVWGCAAVRLNAAASARGSPA